MEKLFLPVVIEKDADGYFAYGPQLQGCYTQGDTYEEALENIRDAIGLHIEDRQMDHANFARRLRTMKCIVQGCPGEMEQRRIVHTFVCNGNPIVVEDLPAWVCPVCRYTVLDLHVLDTLFALDLETETPVGQAPVFRLPLSLAA